MGENRRTRYVVACMTRDVRIASLPESLRAVWSIVRHSLHMWLSIHAFSKRMSTIVYTMNAIVVAVIVAILAVYILIGCFAYMKIYSKGKPESPLKGYDWNTVIEERWNALTEDQRNELIKNGYSLEQAMAEATR